MMEIDPPDPLIRFLKKQERKQKEMELKQNGKDIANLNKVN